jgi:8-oxo-dGTP pyrophosphatase MutT (NUDIX family)
MSKPEAVCIVCIHPETGEILAATRPHTTDMWGLIGGKVDPGESPIQAAYREFAEETGQAITSPLAYITTMEDEVDFIVHVFRVMPATEKYIAGRISRDSAFSVEPNILVSYVPYVKLLNFEPFRLFNTRLLNILLTQTVNA